jgi:DNA-binding NarL/FixJ family response regulator
MLRAGLRGMLAAEGLEVVAEAASPADLGERPISSDVLVLGDANVPQHLLRLMLADGDGSATSMIVLSEDDTPAASLADLPLAGWGIVNPDATAGELAAAVEAVVQGLVVVSLPLARRVLTRGSAVQSVGGVDGLAEPLTERETEVLDLLSQGLSNKLIARELGISEHTVKFHVSSLYTKLGAASRTDAVQRGARLGLVTF